MEQEWFRIIQAELHYPTRQTTFTLGKHGIPAKEIRLVGFNSKTKPGLKHMILTGDVMTKVTKALFDPAPIHHMQAT